VTRTRTARITIACAVAYILVMGLGNAIVHNFSHVSYGDTNYVRAMLPFLFLLAAGSLCCFLVRRKQLAPVSNERGRLPLFLLLFLPLVGMALFYVFTNGELSTAFLTPLVATLLVGFAEEMMFRRILYMGLLREPGGQSIKGALLVSSVVFSLLHSVNVLAGSPFSNVLVQLVTTFVAGLFYALMYDYTRNIGLLIASHFLWDYLLLGGAATKIPVFSVVITMLNVAQFIIVIVFLVKRWKQEKAVAHETAQQAAAPRDHDSMNTTTGM